MEYAVCTLKAVLRTIDFRLDAPQVRSTRCGNELHLTFRDGAALDEMVH